MDHFIHPPREDFAATMTDGEREVWDRLYFERLERMLADGTLILAGPTLARGELREFRASLLRGRDQRARQDSNLRLPPPEGGALSTELRARTRQVSP